MSGQHRAGEVVEAPCACLAPIPLPVSLGLIKAVSDHGTAAACGAVDTLRPAMLAYQGEALGILDQRREVDQIRYRHIRGSSRRVAGSRRPRPTITEVLQARYPDLLPPPRNPIRATHDYRAQWQNSSQARGSAMEARGVVCLLTVISAPGPYAMWSWTTAILSNAPRGS